MTINLGRRLPAASSGQPGRLGRAPLSLPYLALLRAGFGRPAVHTTAGGLLPHHFTLIPPRKDGMFLFHFPSSYLAWALPSALPGGARTFLPDESGRSPDLLDSIYYISWLPAGPDHASSPDCPGPGSRADRPACSGRAGWTLL